MTSFNDIATNRIKLDSCKQHEFSAASVVELIEHGQKVTCLNCEGEMHLGEANQYVRGFVAAGGNPNEVWEGWANEGEELICRCPQCLGKRFIETLPEDYHDCDLCESEGYVSVSKAREYFKELKEKAKENG